MDPAVKKMVDNLPAKTGKSLEEWLTLLGKQGLVKHGENVKWLKGTHGVGHGFANLITKFYLDQGKEPEADVVGAQYVGKENLRPIYEALHAFLLSLGPDVQVSPKRGSVSYIRKHQFALIKPATKTRIDLGLKLKGKPTTDRLGDSGPFGTMCTHRVKLSYPE
ncbi:MAG: DUF4287 domain-containing protein, partial [Bacteroidota bacterium]